MRIEEAKYIKSILDKLNADMISPCINIGSSTRKYRTLVKPHINKYLIAPLVERKIKLLHMDLKMADGVDLAGDIFNSSIQKTLSNVSAKLILCCNMFEHIEDRKKLAIVITQLLKKGGYLLISVPNSYPLHQDPIDTYFRPEPDDIKQLFQGFEVIDKNIVESCSYLGDIFSGNNVRADLSKLCKRILTVFYPFFKKGEWKNRHHRLLWLFRPYKITVVLLRKNA